MSAYTTKTVTKEEAYRLLQLIYAKRFQQGLTTRELKEELNRFAYSEEHEDILGVLFNFDVSED